MTIYDFMTNNPGTTFLLALFACCAVCSFFSHAAIVFRGYPPPENEHCNGCNCFVVEEPKLPHWGDEEKD